MAAYTCRYNALNGGLDVNGLGPGIASDEVLRATTKPFSKEVRCAPLEAFLPHSRTSKQVS
jgi:hypothetical protein